MILVMVLFSSLLRLGLAAVRLVLREPGALLLVVPSGRRLGLFSNTLLVSAAVSVTATVIGVLAASVLAEMEEGPASVLRWGFLVLAPVPPYIHALTWSSAFNAANALLGLRLPTYGGWINFWVEVMAWLPFAVGLALIGLRSVETPAVEAARLYRGDLGVFLRVVVPLAAPAVVAAAGFLFIFTATDYSVPTLYSVNVYALEVFADFSATNSLGRALLLSLPLAAVTLLVLGFSQRALRATFQSSSVSRPGLRLRFPGWFDALRYAGLLVAVSQFVVLVLTLVLETGGVGDVLYAVGTADSSIMFSFWQSVATAALCLPLGYLAAVQLGEEGGRGWLVYAAPLAIPAPLIGISLIGLLGGSPLYGTVAVPVLGTVIRFTPIAALILHAQLQLNDPLLFEAARVFERSWLDSWLRVRLPLQASGIVGALGVVFAFTLGELGATLLTVPPGFESITVRVFNYLHYGSTVDVAGLCLVMVAAMLASGCAVMLFFKAKARYVQGRVQA